MNQEHKKGLLRKGIINGNFPTILYKYRTVAQAKKILENFSFWFANPETFNDPFDCGLSENQNPTLDDARNHFKKLGISNSSIDSAIAVYRANPEKLIELIESVKNKSIYSRGVLSLSEKFDDILMWSHYSEYHKGVVFGLDMSADLDFFLSPIRIDYKDSYEELNYLVNPESSTIDTLKIKSSQWSYEREIRVYKNESRLYQIDEKAIREVYFGINSTKQDIDEIRQICSDLGLRGISFFRGEKVHGKFEIKFNQL